MDDVKCQNCQDAGEMFAVDGCPCCAELEIEQEPDDYEVSDGQGNFRTVKV